MTDTLIASRSTVGRDWLQLLATCLTAVLIPLCFTGPAVVLPSISRDLGGTVVELNWVVNAYILSYGSAMMASGSLTDIYGRKRVWPLGLVVFCLATFAIPLAPTVAWIDGLRLVQGLGGAAAFAGAMSSLAQNFHGAARTRMFSLLGTTFGLGLAFGPLAAGWLVDMAGWRWVFLVTGLIGVVGYGLVRIGVSESRDPEADGLDWPGAISFTAALTVLTYGILQAPEEGWRAAAVPLLLALVLFGVFVLIERRVRRPMLDLSLFSSGRFVGVQVLAATPAFFFVNLIVILPGRFIGIDGLSALEAGRLMIALAAPLLVVPFLAALCAHRFSAGLLSAVGLLLMAAGLWWLAEVLPQGAGPGLVAPLLVIGIGVGIPWGLMDGMAVSVVEKERAGMATGIFNCVRVSADGIAIAVTGALLAWLIQEQLFAVMGAVDPAVVIEAANRAALGDIGSMAERVGLYDSAFSRVLQVLAVAAVLTAGLVYGMLGRASSVKSA